jgi:hypothetical protein
MEQQERNILQIRTLDHQMAILAEQKRNEAEEKRRLGEEIRAQVLVKAVLRAARRKTYRKGHSIPHCCLP